MAARVSRPSPPAAPQHPERVKIPAWDLDPVGSLRPWPLVLRLNGQDVQLPVMSAADWLDILMRPDLDFQEILDLIPGFNEYLMDSDIDLEEIKDLALELITIASSRKWWITLRLLGVAIQHWDVIGSTMITKLDPDRVSLAAWMTVLQLTLIEGMEPKNATMFVAQVQAPPPGVTSITDTRQDLSAKEFLAISG